MPGCADESAFAVTSEICWPQSRLSLIVIPRYLADWTCSNIWSWRVLLNIICLSGRCRFTLIEWHLATLNFICQLASHLTKLSRSPVRFHSQQRSLYFYIVHNRQQKTNRPDVVWKIIDKNKKRTGTRTEPWGKPDKTGTGSEAMPSKTAFCERQRAMS